MNLKVFNFSKDFIDLIKANTFINLSNYFDNNKVDLFIQKSRLNECYCLRQSIINDGQGLKKAKRSFFT